MAQAVTDKYSISIMIEVYGGKFIFNELKANPASIAAIPIDEIVSLNRN